MPALVQDIPVAPIAFFLVSTQPLPIGMVVGATFQCAAELRDQNQFPITGRPIVWATGDANVMTVTQGGLITAVGAGTTPVIATGEGIQTIVGTVTVSSPGAVVASVTATPNPISGTPGQPVIVTAYGWDGPNGTGNKLTGKTGSALSNNTPEFTVGADDNSQDPAHIFAVQLVAVGGPANLDITIT